MPESLGKDDDGQRKVTLMEMIFLVLLFWYNSSYLATQNVFFATEK